MTDHDRSLETNGMKNSAKGKLTSVKGKAKEAVGDITGDMSMQAKGKLDHNKGKAQDALGKAQRKAGR